jgi:site-specific DNA recombinase
MKTMVATMTTTKEKDIIASVKNVAGVLRISTEKTDSLGKKVNIEKTLMNHKEKMLSVLNEKKWNYNLYEEVMSGTKDLEERPELQRLISEIDQYDAIICMEITRLSRQGLTSQTIKHTCKKKGILIITLNPFKVYDMRNPQDVFLFDLSISMGEYEQGVVSLRVKQNKISMAHQGLNSSGSVPFGYVRNPSTKKLEIEMVQ